MLKSNDFIGPNTYNVLYVLQIDNLFGMLDHLYAKFDKAHYAGLCKSLAVGKSIVFSVLNCF